MTAIELNGNPQQHLAGVEGETLRETMRLIASPVVVVTAQADGDPRGATIGSFTSVSLEPPLVSFNVTQGTRLHDTLTRVDRFAVNVLAVEQAPLAEHFALPNLEGVEQFADVDHMIEGNDPPLIMGTLGALVCRPETRIPVGDHIVFVGLVISVHPGKEGLPLAFHDGSYHGLGEPVGNQFESQSFLSDADRDLLTLVGSETK